VEKSLKRPALIFLFNGLHFKSGSLLAFPHFQISLTGFRYLKLSCAEDKKVDNVIGNNLWGFRYKIKKYFDLLSSSFFPSIKKQTKNIQRIKMLNV